MARERAGRYTDGADAPANSFEEAERATAKVLMFALAGLFVPFIVLMLVLVYERGVMFTLGRFAGVRGPGLIAAKKSAPPFINGAKLQALP